LTFDPKEWSIFAFKKITKGLDIKLKSRADLSHKKRVIKSERELNLIREAVRLGAEAFNNFAYLIDKYGFEKSEHELKHMMETTLSLYGRREISLNR